MIEVRGDRIYWDYNGYKKRKNRMSQNSKPKNNAKPMPIGQIRINLFANGSVNVSGFPNDFRSSMQMMAAATQAVAGFFVAGAAENRFDKNGVDKNAIIVAPPGSISKN